MTVLNQPKRKQIRLNDYDYSKNNAYFITICTYNRAHLFGKIVNTILSGRPHDPDKMIIKWLFEIENKYLNAKIDKFVIMTDLISIIRYCSIILQYCNHTGNIKRYLFKSLPPFR